MKRDCAELKLAELRVPSKGTPTEPDQCAKSKDQELGSNSVRLLAPRVLKTALPARNVRCVRTITNRVERKSIANVKRHLPKPNALRFTPVRRARCSAS
eukprot:6189195-Pleurochrysis_carterae.AAC.1